MYTLIQHYTFVLAMFTNRVQTICNKVGGERWSNLQTAMVLLVKQYKPLTHINKHSTLRRRKFEKLQYMCMISKESTCVWDIHLR